jgi:hypothetical protein
MLTDYAPGEDLGKLIKRVKHVSCDEIKHIMVQTLLAMHWLL